MGTTHLRSYAGTPDVRIVALVTHSSTRGAELAARFPIEAVFDDVATMLETAQPDGISVTTAEHDHVAPACQALEAGVGVLIEKPMASNLPDALTIAASAERSEAILMPAHVLRFAAPYQALKREVESGRIGRVLAIASRRDRSRAIAQAYGHIHPAMLTSVHDIDLVLWLAGSRVTRVRAVQSQPPDRPQPDLVWAQLELESGVVATVSTTMLYPAVGGVTSADRIDVYGTDGVAAVDLTPPLVAVHTGEGTAPDWWLEPPDGGGAFGAEIAHFCDCLRSGRSSDVVSATEAVAGLRVADAIIRSASADAAVIEL